MEQARTMSKCSSCHVVGKSKSINEVTQEFNPAISYRFGIFDIEYKFLYREFTDKSEDMTNNYMTVQNPGKPPGGNADFDQRMQFGEGILGYSNTPDSIKYSHKLKVKVTTPVHTANLGGIYSEAINQSSDGDSALNGGVGEELSVDYYAVNGGWHWRINRAMSLTVKGKYHKQDGDDVFIDVNDQIMTSGPGAGLTYADYLGTNFDYTRDSAYDKEVYVSDVKVNWRMSKKIKLNFGYNIEYENRENAIHLHLVEDTTTHKFSIGSAFQPTRSVKIKTDYKYTYVQDPYLFKHALCPSFSNAEDEGYSPGTYADTSWYSKYVYGMRTASSTNRAGQIHEMKIKSYWSPTSNLSTNLYARYKYAVNDDADINDWNQNMFNGGIGAMYAINSKSEINFGYNFFYDKYDATFCAAYYHGWAGHVGSPQLGGANDDYGYETEAHTFYVGASTRPISKLSLASMFSYTVGKASSDNLHFNSNPFVLTVNGRTDDYDFANVNNIDELSDLKYTAMGVELSATYAITDNLDLTANYIYSDYQDDEEYVYGDTSGETQAIAAFVTFRF